MAANGCPPEDDRARGSETSDSGPVGRLTRRADFLAIAGGRRFRTPRLTIMARARPSQNGAHRSDAASGLRVGLTVTKKIGHASERNRIKRRLKAATAAAAGDWRHSDADVVILARREALSAPFRLLVDDLTQGLPELLRGRNKAPHQRGADG